jgi:hypothetical protein
MLLGSYPTTAVGRDRTCYWLGSTGSLGPPCPVAAKGLIGSYEKSAPRHDRRLKGRNDRIHM